MVINMAHQTIHMTLLLVHWCMFVEGVVRSVAPDALRVSLFRLPGGRVPTPSKVLVQFVNDSVDNLTRDLGSSFLLGV